MTSTATDDTAGINASAWTVTQTGTYFQLGADDVVTEQTATGEAGVTLTQGAETQKAPRNAEVTLANDKTETGSITIHKTLLYNGSVDTTAMDADSWYRHAAGDAAVSQRHVQVALYDNAKAEGKPVDTQTITFLDESGADVGTGSATFDDLPFGTYYVFELDDEGDPVTGTSGQFFGLAYTVSASNKAQVVSHETCDRELSFTNSYKEQGTIVVTKQLLVSGTGAADTTQAGAQFRVGLFTLVDPAGSLADISNYRLVNGRTQYVTVDENGEASATFDRLDFEAAGTTYYIFEVNDNLEPLLNGDTYKGCRVSYGEDATSTAGGMHPFTLTPAQHLFDGGEGHAEGATVTNYSLPADLRIVKVDKNSPSTVLSGAAFTLYRLDETDAEKASYDGDFTPVTSEVTDADGITEFRNVTGGYYEVVETAAPADYVLSGDRSFYLRVLNGKVIFLEREDGKAPSEWEATTTPSLTSNVLAFAAATTVGDQTTPATATVGNFKGTILPSSGSSAGLGLMVAGVTLGASGVAMLRRRRDDQSAGEVQ